MQSDEESKGRFKYSDEALVANAFVTDFCARR